VREASRRATRVGVISSLASIEGNRKL
jgi:hypothetical protein